MLLDKVEIIRAKYINRQMFHADAGEEEQTNSPKPAPKAPTTFHGNTRLPFGLCKEYGIEVGDDWTPRDAWEALKGKGVSPKKEYKKLEKTGKKKTPEDKPSKDSFKDDIAALKESVGNDSVKKSVAKCENFITKLKLDKGDKIKYAYMSDGLEKTIEYVGDGKYVESLPSDWTSKPYDLTDIALDMCSDEFNFKNAFDTLKVERASSPKTESKAATAPKAKAKKETKKALKKPKDPMIELWNSVNAIITESDDLEFAAFNGDHIIVTFDGDLDSLQYHIKNQLEKRGMDVGFAVHQVGKDNYKVEVDDSASAKTAAEEKKSESIGSRMKAMREKWEKIPTLKNFSQRKQVRADTRAKEILDHKLTKEEKKILSDAAAKIFKGGKMMTRVPDVSVLCDIIDSHFKNQIELDQEGKGDSKGLYNPSYRRDVSSEMFGTTKGTVKKGGYEFYGYLDTGSDEGVTHYGSIKIKFKDDAVKDRVTYTLGDSFINRCAGVAGNPPSYEGMLNTYNSDIRKILKKPGMSKDELLYDVSYVELQYHGGVTIDDVESIEFTNAWYSHTLPKKYYDILNKKGIKLSGVYSIGD